VNRRRSCVRVAAACRQHVDVLEDEAVKVGGRACFNVTDVYQRGPVEHDRLLLFHDEYLEERRAACGDVADDHVTE